MSRDYQIVVWGATGFTGRLVVEYLQDNYNDQIRWAIAGRDIQKLQVIKEQLRISDHVGILVGESFDFESLKAISSKTDVLISTVGPYMNYGKLMLQACVETQTDYCDLTGEIPFIKNSIDQFHEQAKVNQTKIVHSCGFDSIPSDIGCLLLQKKAIEKFGQPASNVKLFLMGMRGQFSGGTIASMKNQLKVAKDPMQRKLLTDPYVICSTINDPMPVQKMQNFVHYDSRIHKWTAPFIMSMFNSRIVFRTNDLNGYQYGREFIYDEGMSVGTGMKGKFKGILFVLILGIFMQLMKWSVTSYILSKTVLPKPGEGPDKNIREHGFFKIRLIGQNADEGNRLEVEFENSKDPGYGSTAIMLAESALCLALNKSQLPEQYGVITPAVAMDAVIAERLKKAGFHILVKD